MQLECSSDTIPPTVTVTVTSDPHTYCTLELDGGTTRATTIPVPHIWRGERMNEEKKCDINSAWLGSVSCWEQGNKGIRDRKSVILTSQYLIHYSPGITPGHPITSGRHTPDISIRVNIFIVHRHEYITPDRMECAR